MRWRGRLHPGLTRVILFAMAIAPALAVQAQGGQAVSFDVASIRPAAIAADGKEAGSRSQIESADDSLTMRNIDLSEMVLWAYGLRQFQLVVAGAVPSERYDVRARAGEKVPESTLRRMMQDLLANRFKLRIHREQKRTAVYELEVAGGGPKLPKDKSATLPAVYARESLPRVMDGGFVFSNVSMGEFAQQLSELRGIDLPVVDRTGIPGVYEITLKGAASAILDPQGPSLFTLIQEQLGLKLVSAKDPVEVMVVDHAERPSEN